MIAAALVLLVALAVAALLAAVDGALLATGDGVATDPAAAALVRDRERSHRAMSAARVIAFLAAGAALEVLVAYALGPARTPQRFALAVLGGAVLLAVLGEAAPWAIGDAAGPRALARLAPLARAVQVLFAPVTGALARLDADLLRALPSRVSSDAAREAATAQFRQVVAVEADVTRRERTFLNGVFSLRDTEVRDVMVPRVDVVGIDRDSSWSEVTDRVRSREHARYPVYVETLDEVVGILYTKDLLPWVVSDEPPTLGWPALARPATFIPTTKTIDAQLRDFKSSGSHIAIVVDEYGGTAGLVTIEDILEQIVGEIRDEHDEEEDEVEQEAGRKFWVSGRLTLEQLSELLGRDFEREGIATVAGLVYDILGRVPRAGEELSINSHRVVVERVVGRQIRRVYFERAETLAAREAD